MYMISSEEIHPLIKLMVSTLWLLIIIIVDDLFYKPLIYYIRSHNASVVVYSKASSLNSIAVNSGSYSVVGLWHMCKLYLYTHDLETVTAIYIKTSLCCH